MKKGIHPELKDCKVTCSCGATFMTKSTKDEIYIEVCNECHPFYTGKQGKSKKAGNIEKFNRKYGITEEASK
jgi:large subunit ribosomal protein L31